MELAEDLTVGEHVVSCLIHAQEVDDAADYLNMENAAWGKQGTRNDSFVTLYNDAVADAAEMIGMLYAYTQGRVSRSVLLERINGRSLVTGVNGV